VPTNARLAEGGGHGEYRRQAQLVVYEAVLLVR
jgi:hypothetical protein